MKLGSLFSGCRGLDLGLERSGMEAVFYAEIDKQANQVIEAHTKGVPNLGNVANLKGKDLPQIDVLAGGFPCTDISAGRDRWGADGIEGARSGMWWHFLRLINEAQPEWVIVENVERLRNGRGGKDLRAVVGGLKDASYVGLATVLDAAAFGLPARRSRVFIVARRVRNASDLEQAERMVNRFVGIDPGCVVLEGSRRARSEDDGRERPTRSNYRMMTPREAERCMGFPDDFTRYGPDGKEIANTHRYRMLGNAVPPPMAEFVGSLITKG